MKINVHNIVEYELHKEDFYKNRNEKIEAVITKEYCEYEELKYGNNLTEIYIGLSKITEGKYFFKKHLKHMVLITIIMILISLVQYFFKENICNLLFNIGIILPLIIITLTVLNIRKYWLFLKYLYFKKLIGNCKGDYMFLRFANAKWLIYNIKINGLKIKKAGRKKDSK